MSRRVPSAIAAKQEAIEAGKETYLGKLCYRDGHGSERYVHNSHCVQCAKEGRRYMGGQIRDTNNPLGRAHHIWTELQRKHPETPAYRLWGRFLSSLQDDPETLNAAIENIEPLEPPRRSPQQERIRHARLNDWAEQNGVIALEQKMRQALAAGRTSEASRLRAESLALMRQGAAMVGKTLARCSS
jgi:hypothetical protein